MAILQAGVKHVVLAVSYRAEMLEQEMKEQETRVCVHLRYQCTIKWCHNVPSNVATIRLNVTHPIFATLHDSQLNIPYSNMIMCSVIIPPFLLMKQPTCSLEMHSLV